MLLVAQLVPAYGKRPVRPPPSPTDPVLALALHANELYRAGRFQESIEQLERAWAMRPDPHLLFNLGRAHHQLGHWQEAGDSYWRYLTLEHDIPPERRARVESWINEIPLPPSPPPPGPTQAVARPERIQPPALESPKLATPAAPPPSSLPPATPLPIYKRWWPWTIAIGVVAGAVTVGVVAAYYRDPPIDQTDYGPIPLH